jgi:hypothetical protein
MTQQSRIDDMTMRIEVRPLNHPDHDALLMA